MEKQLVTQELTADDLLTLASKKYPTWDIPAGSREHLHTRLDSLGYDHVSTHIHDIFLAWCAGCGNSYAVELVDQVLIRVLPSTRRTGLPDCDVEEVGQTVRAWLFSPREQTSAVARGPGIFGYEGRGELAAWLKAVVLKNALKIRQKNQRAKTLQDSEDALLSLLTPEQNPWETLGKSQFLSSVRGILGQSLLQLEPSHRRVLRAHILEGKTIDVLAEELGIHRATAARRIHKACDTLRRSVVANLAGHDAFSNQEAKSMLSWVESQLEMSWSRLLPPQCAD